ncbi:hypothetical protein [Acetatifactor muris]|uniref:hypothetical protein n=1 Tax=Acetatifactor muris TaxID=879566 RepID=UPI0023F16F71|nr:hypothetical protein [Acetatifactor muris]
MTSKHLFFKAMKEDLRHKIWMTALSFLGSFLALPVAWLLWRSNVLRQYGGMEGLLMKEKLVRQENIMWIFNSYVPGVCGFLAITGAVIVGLSGFRYVFHKNMVDTYHSLPVKRSTLYGACYLNGILIWLVPLLTCLLLTLAMGGSFMVRLGGEEILGTILRNLGISVLVLTVVYLLIYHLVLTAVMLSGNALNTLVCMGFLGFGVISFYALGLTYFDSYMDTFYFPVVDWGNVPYFSPLLGAPDLLTQWIDSAGQWSWQFGKVLLTNAGVAGIFGMAAWLFYRRRTSETAGQGMGNKTAAACFRILMGVEAGMCGWGLFVLLTSNAQALTWGSFGSVLASILTFGILDIIFQMDFKAFFAHKIQMAVTVMLGLLVCFTFYWDWIGFDTRLPDADEIAEIAIYDAELSNRLFYDAAENALEQIHYQDTEVIYAFLKEMTEREAEGNLTYENYERVAAKVTLKSGESYYRYYRVLKEDEELLWPIFTSETYLKHAYMLDEDSVADCVGMKVSFDRKEQRLTDNLPEKLLPVIRAYNQDVLENADNMLLNQDKMLAEVELEFRYQSEKGRRWKTYNLYILESMEHTIEALHRTDGLDMEAQKPEIQSVVLDLGYQYDESVDKAIWIERAREIYGVPAQPGQNEAGRGQTDIRKEEAGEGNGPGEDIVQKEAVSVDTEAFPDGGCRVVVTDREEIEELEALLIYIQNYYHRSVFQRRYISVTVKGEDGDEWMGYLPKGALPEKYILRFGD